MDLRQLRYFLAVADERHFRRAAERVGISQPPLSARIRQLETELGVRLFTRGPGEPVELTDAGNYLARHARALVDDAERAHTQITRIARGEAGILRIGIQPGIPSTLLLDGILAFRHEWPDIELAVGEFGGDRILQDVSRGLVDVGLVSHVRTPLVDGATELLRNSLGVSLGHDHPAAQSSELDLDELEGCALVLPAAVPGSCRDDIVTSCRAFGFDPVAVTVATDADGFADLLAVASEPARVVALMTEPCSRRVPWRVWRPLRDAQLVMRTSAIVCPAPISCASSRLAEAIHDASARFVRSTHRPDCTSL